MVVVFSSNIQDLDGWDVNWHSGNSNIEDFTCHLTLKNLLVGVPNENQWLGGGNVNVFGNFTPKIGEMIPYLTSISFKWG